MAETLFINLKKQDTQLRFAATLLCFHIIPALTSQVQTVLFFSLFVVHALYLIIDMRGLYHSINIHWIDKESRNIREGMIDTSLAVLQLIASGFIITCLFSQTLLAAGILSSHMMPLVSEHYNLLVNGMYRSGYMFALTFTRQQLENGELNFVAKSLTNPKTSYLFAFAFLFMTLYRDYAILAAVGAVPFIALSTFYCLDILAYGSNDLAAPSDGNYLATVIVGISHGLSFLAWAIILKTSLSIFVASLPGELASQVLNYVPEFLIMNEVQIETNYIVASAMFTSCLEVIRSKIYDQMQFNPEQSLSHSQMAMKAVKSRLFKNTKEHKNMMDTPRIGRVNKNLGNSKETLRR